MTVMEQDKHSPMLAVVISSFNYEKYVGQAIESVISQLSGSTELIVVDDGSTDNSWAIIQSYGIQKAFRLTNCGQINACMFGVQQSNAPFFLFLDSDDALAPGALATILNVLDPTVAKVQFALTPIDANGAILGPPAPSLSNFRRRSELIEEILATGTYVSPPTSGNVFCRSLCELAADVDYEPSIDGITLLAAPFYGDVISISAPLGFYRVHSLNLSQVGNVLTVERARKESQRFVCRLRHLQQIIAARGYNLEIEDIDAFFYIKERQAFEEIVSGRGLTVWRAVSMLPLLWTSNRSVRQKLEMSFFIFGCSMLPAEKARILLDYRLQLGRRSVFGALKVCLRTSAREYDIRNNSN